MNFFTGFFKLIRGVNLIYIALTQVLLQYCVLWPLLETNPTLQGVDFFLLVFSTVIIAASGYMINDYFDVKIDEINKPKRILVDRILPRRKIMILHVVFNFVGVAIGFYLAWKVGDWRLGFIHVLAASLLWFYSVSLKKQFLIGNIIVSLLTALVVATVLLYEVKYFGIGISENQRTFIGRFFIGYMVFAFVVNLIRELIKDMEDIEGDRQGQCKTVPIVWGIKNAKYLTSLILLLTISLVAYVLSGSAGSINIGSNPNFFYLSFAYFFFLVQLPLLYVLYKLFRADKPSDFKHLSYAIKGVMLTGILFLLLPQFF